MNGKNSFSPIAHHAGHFFFEVSSAVTFLTISVGILPPGASEVAERNA